MKIIKGKIYESTAGLLVIATNKQSKGNKHRDEFKGVVIKSNAHHEIGHYSKTWQITRFKPTNKRIKQS